MSEILRFTETQTSNYPYKTSLNLKAEDAVDFELLPAEIIPQAANYIAVDLSIGDRKRNLQFHESMTPSNVPTGPALKVEQYFSVLQQNKLPIPPETWRDETVLFIKPMELLTTLQLPENPEDMQGRVLNLAQLNRPLPREDVVFTPLKSSYAYVKAIEDTGFPREAFKDNYVPYGVQVFLRGALPIFRAINLIPKPASDGQLTAAVRTENSRPDTRR